jgi:protein NRD1
LVSILYRRHKSLPADKKVHGLYAFNALATAARHKVNKHGITADLNAEKGNCATFLLKMDGVLDGLFKDMLSTGNSECKVS